MEGKSTCRLNNYRIGEIGEGVLPLSRDYSYEWAVGRLGCSNLVRCMTGYAKGAPVIAICHGTGARCKKLLGAIRGGVAFGMQFTGLPVLGAFPKLRS